MALRYAVANGNWSSTATWDGGTLPTSVDDVYADGKAVVIDQNVTVLTIRTTQRSGGINGGSFTVSGSGFTINATAPQGILPGLTAGIIFTHSSGTNTLIANATAGTTSWVPAIQISTTSIAVTNIIGNLVGSPNNLGDGLRTLAGATGTLNITGNISSNIGSAPGWGQAYGVAIASAITVNITGNITGPGTIGLFSSSISGTVINITGNCIGGSNFGLQTASNTIVNHIGQAIASSGAAGIFINGAISNTTYTGTGNFTNNSGVPACVLICKVRLYNSSSVTWVFQNELGGNKTLYSAGTALGNPAVTDVRDGTTYASGALTGTLKVPPASSVAVGVPVDNTTGTAMISVTDMGVLLASYNT